MPIIEIHGLTHQYLPGTPMAVTALSNIELSVEAGEFVGILGHTGSGKSTLVQYLNGLLRPKDTGRVIVDGNDVGDRKVPLRALRQRVGLVFQYPEYQIFEETVAQDVAFGPTNLGLSPKEVQERVQEALRAVRLDPRRYGDRSPYELSGGELRRVALAGVLAMRPKILILDEPTAGLDPRGRDQLLELVRSWHRERHLTVLMVSHSMDDVAQLANRLVVLHRGHLVMNGTPREVFQRAAELEAIGLGIPQVTQLMIQLHQAGLPVDPACLTLDQAERELVRLGAGKGRKGGATRA
ncbi:MAG: energy-coupling factor transporter ATPase [Firmicutes bacterium]|nr:energy-coupling factor transporter ATPase [Bacillota bacterium]